MTNNELIKLSVALINDEAFLNTSCENIISTIKNAYIFKDIDIIELSKYINIAQRKKKIIKLNEKILESKI